MTRMTSSCSVAWVFRGLVTILMLFTSASAGAQSEPVLMEIPEDALIEGTADQATQARVVKPTRAPLAAISPIYSTNDSFTVSYHTFDTPSGSCLPRGWTGRDRTGRIYSHVSTRFVESAVLFSSHVVNMGTRAVWVGADDTSAPEEVVNWVHPYGYGNDWSQRIVSPPFSLPANAILTFDASLDLGTAPAIVAAGFGPEFFVVQGLTIFGAWAFLSSRIHTTTSDFTTVRVTGRGVFQCEVRTGADGNESVLLANPARLRIVVQTDTGNSNEDGGVPTGRGAAVLDNLRIRDAADDSDIVPTVDCEDGTTGAWTLKAFNGVLSTAIPSHVVDAPLPDSRVELVSNFDPNDPTCVWKTTSPRGFNERGSFVELISPWFAAYGLDVVVCMSGKFQNVSTDVRFFQFRFRGKNDNDSRPRMHVRPSATTAFVGVPDEAASAFFRFSRRYPIVESVGLITPIGSSVRTDSLQAVIRFFSRNFDVGLSGTRHPFFDNLEIYLMRADSDFDGVADSVDACPTVSAAGQDADGDGCVDEGATLRHAESWSASRPVRFTVSANGHPDITDGSDIQAVVDGFQAWEGAQGSNLAIQVDPTTADISSSAFDETNLITFEDANIALPPNVVAVTPTTSFLRRSSYNDVTRLPGEIVDADMIFNPALDFSTPTHNAGPGSFDLKSVVAHEAGHFLGLSHSGVLDATMFFVLQPGAGAASLEEDDLSAVASAYPSPGLFADFGSIAGHVRRGGTGAPIAGALVTAVRLIGGTPQDSVATDFSDEDGAYVLRRLVAGDYAVRVTPLDGEIGGYPLTPEYISARVEASAVTNFPAEWWDAAENGTESDDPDAYSAVSVVAGTPVMGIDVTTNVDTTPPQVTSSFPAGGATDVRIDAGILVNFSERIDAATLTGATFRLRVQGMLTAIGGGGFTVNGDRSFFFAPNPPLEFNTSYELELTTGIRDREGVSLAAPYLTTFSTEARPNVAITDVQPRSAPVGAFVTILGAGFDGSTSNDVSFTFCPTCTPVVVAGSSVTPSSMVVRIPDGADTGPIQVTVNAEASNAFNLTILPPSPQAAPSSNDRFQLPAGFSPTDVAIAPDGLTVYAVGSGGFATVSLDSQNQDFRIPRVEPLAAGTALALTPDGSRAYVTRRERGDVIAVDASPASGTFRQILRTIPLEFASTPGADAVVGLPEGIAIAGTGKRAYVTDRLEGVVFQLDIDPRSFTRDQVVGEIRDPDAVLVGGVAVSPGSDKVFFATSNAGSRSFDLATAVSAAVNPEVGGDGAAITPTGGEVLFTGGGVSGGRLLYSQLDGSGAGAVQVGGDLRDVAVSPRGQSAFVVNATFNQLQVVNVDPMSSSYHSVVSQTATEGNPAAVHVSGDGNLIAVANQGTSSISLFGTGAAGQIVRVTPPVAFPGDRVSVALSPGLAATGARVDLGAGAFAVSRAAPLAAGVAFALPMLAQHDAALAFVEADGDRTLAAALRVVDPIEGLTPRATGLNLNPVPVDCGGTPAVGSLDIVRPSPDGLQLAVARSTPCALLLDLYRSGDDTRYGELLTTVVLSAAAGQIVSLAYTPDGRRIWASIGTTQILEVDTDPSSPTFGTVTPFAASPVAIPRAIESDPMGRFMVVAHATGAITFWSPAPRAVISTLTTILDFRSMAVGRDARHAMIGAAGTAAIVDLDNRTLVGTTTTRGTAAIHSIAVMANGRRAVGAFADGNLAIWNLEASGTIGAELYFGNPLPVGVTLSQLLSAPDGDGILGGCATCNDVVKIEAAVVPPTVTTAGIGRTSAALARSHDGRQLWVAEWNTGAGTGVVALTSLSEASQMALVSGANQAGASGTTLPLPTGVRVADEIGRPQVGVVVRFELGSGLGSLDGQGTVVHRVTDANGEARVSWTLPGTPGTETVTITALGVPGASLMVSAEVTGDDTQIVPQVVAVGPANGATDISIGTAAFVRFNQRIDTASLNTGKIQLLVNGAIFGRSIEFLEDGRVVVLRPSQSLPFGKICTIKVLAGTLDVEGQATTAEASATFTVQAEPPLSVQSIMPPSAPIATPVVLAGQGFSLVPAQNIVSFNGVLADVLTSNFEELRVNVPQGAASGPVTVTVGAVTSNPVQYTLPAPAVLGEIIDDIRISPGARDIAITEDGRHAYITNPATSTVSAIRLDPPALLRSITVGLRPQGIAIVPGIQQAYVANTSSNDLSVIDVNPLSATFNREIARIPVDPEPVDVAVNPIGPQIVAVHADDQGTVSFIDADPENGTYNRVVAKTTTGSGGTGVVVTTDGTRGYVLTRDGQLIELDLRPGVPPDQRVVSKTATGSGGSGVAISTDGTRFVAVLTVDGELLIVDIVPQSATKHRVVSKTSIGSGGTGVVVTTDGGSAYVTTSNNEVLRFKIGFTSGSAGASVIPGSEVTVELVERKATDLSPAGVAVEPAGPRMVVANEGSGTARIYGPLELPPPVAEIFFDPKIYHLGAKDQTASVSIELPLPFLSANIDPLSVRLNETVQALPGFVMADRDSDGVQEMKLMFSRTVLDAKFQLGDQVQVRLTGMVGAKPFSGADTIKVKKPKKGSGLVSMEEPPSSPELLLLGANPAREEAAFALGLPGAARVVVEVFDVSGRRIRTLTSGDRDAGWHSLRWDGAMDGGSNARPGIYFTRLTTGGVRIDRRIVWLQ